MLLGAHWGDWEGVEQRNGGGRSMVVLQEAGKARRMIQGTWLLLLIFLYVALFNRE
jgi:hypothetical protein